jgi:hypothetical protein
MALRPPSLGLEQQLVLKKPSATNDEVASILKGLGLDRKFFLSRLDQSQTQDLLPSAPQEKEDGGNDADAPGSGPGGRRVCRMKTKVLKNRENRKVNKKATDFDLFLGEALMPVLAQALDSLCRQVNRMQMQGENLDPKVRARFNPLTWLAQQLLRRHPKCAKSPRRQAIYANFRDWSDLERGRREMLRRRDVVQDVFEGFVLRGVVQRADLDAVLDAIDDTLRLDGVLKNNKAVRRALLLEAAEPESPSSKRQAPRGREEFFKDGGWTFDQFWLRFANVIMSNDVVPFSAIQRGIESQQQQALLRSEAEVARKKEEEDRKQREADQRRRNEEYVQLHAEMQENKHIQAILDSEKALTGDDVRPGDAGYEFEVPPNGAHVNLLYRLLDLLGFELGNKPKDGKPVSPGPGSLAEAAKILTAEDAERSSSKVGDRWWDDELAKAWTTLQEIHRAEICDGVVEKDVLEKVLVPPVGFLLLRNRVTEELENREEQEDGLGGFGREDSRQGSKDVGPALDANRDAKPSIDTLCQRLGVSMSRIEWLHRLFESFLTPDPNDPTSVPVCLYPECPAAISKAQMRALMKEVRPYMEEVEFEMRFRRIDTDLSGTIEFDEFVMWVREDEVRVGGAAPLQKMTFEELAVVYSESVELIKYLHEHWQDQFDNPNEKCGYPAKPKSLPKDKIRALVSSLTPDMSDADFETQFQMTTFSKKDCLDFDEFLEVIPLDELPDEIRDGDDQSAGD